MLLNIQKTFLLRQFIRFEEYWFSLLWDVGRFLFTIQWENDSWLSEMCVHKLSFSHFLFLFLKRKRKIPKSRSGGSIRTLVTISKLTFENKNQGKITRLMTHKYDTRSSLQESSIQKLLFLLFFPSYQNNDFAYKLNIIRNVCKILISLATKKRDHISLDVEEGTKRGLPQPFRKKYKKVAQALLLTFKV